ncbi:hypothetical protein NDU88_007459 [Pleurodeles waltl]|uniref:Uncharacterized protein n=1 Tax=Pleurodeles waltl TaxID=8319 RepID=A0AAV7N5Z1_PLEWA|nr:hypothetical protein NDU88_007459 [Pleurodeles waltl]
MPLRCGDWGVREIWIPSPGEEWRQQKPEKMVTRALKKALEACASGTSGALQNSAPRARNRAWASKEQENANQNK